MSFLDSLIGGASDLFSGIGDVAGNLGSDISSWFGGGTDALSGATGSFSSGNVNFLPAGMSSVTSPDWGAALSTAGGNAFSDALGLGAGLGTFSPGSVNFTGGVTPTSLNAPGTFSSSTPVNVTGTSTGGLGSFGGLASGAVKALLGGGTGQGGVAGGNTPAGGTSSPQLTPTGSTAGGGTSGGGILGGLGGLLSNPAAIAGLISPVMAAINAKDQTDLGPDAAKLRTLADNNQNQINQLSAEAQAEKTGQLPGQAMAALEASMAQQKASMSSRYAAMGMSGSSAEGADMAALNQQNESQRFQIGLNMANEGLSQVSGLQSQDVGIYQQLMDAQAQRDQEYMQAMADLASGMGKAFSGAGSTGTTGTTGATPASLASLLQSVGGGLVGSPGGISIPGTDVTAPTPVTGLPQAQPQVDTSGLVTPTQLVPSDFTPATGGNTSLTGGITPTQFDTSSLGNFDPQTLSLLSGVDPSVFWSTSGYT